MPRNTDVEKSERRSSRSEKEFKKDDHKRRNETVISEEKMNNNVTTLDTSSSTINYRGKDKLENYLFGYENKISDIQNHISDKCESEMKAFEEAKEKLEKKLKQVMNSPNMHKMEDEANKAANDVSLHMRHMQREIDSMQDKIQNDKSMPDDEKQNQQRQLSSMAMDEIKRLHKKYPSGMKAQMMSQMLLLT